MITNRGQRGFTLIEIMIVGAIIGLLGVIAIPNYVTSRTIAQRRACVNNLRQIDAAKQQWALEQGKSASDPAAAGTDIQAYIGRGTLGSLKDVICPSGDGAAFDACYAIGDVNTLPICKIVGAAQEPNPVKAHLLP